MKKKLTLIATIAILLTIMLSMIVGLVGCDNNQSEEETQNPFQSVRSPETTEKPKKQIEFNEADTDNSWSAID